MKFSRERVRELWRYYQAGVVNTIFGLGAYSALVWLGLGIFMAQFIAHAMGVAFNYLTYSRHVFRDANPSPGRFLLSYVVNYLIGLITLALVSKFIISPYGAGIVSAGAVSVVNYFILKRFVFLTGAT
ncbi:GtrA family protein [Sphingomonas sp. NCPPB 2930]|uniref:GtrA family protein n=1 Tax=Sphingomonas sp. NCPPB 2930 TaxID=3162788 RepID=UPI0036D7F6D6